MYKNKTYNQKIKKLRKKALKCIYIFLKDQKKIKLYNEIINIPIYTAPASPYTYIHTFKKINYKKPPKTNIYIKDTKIYIAKKHLRSDGNTLETLLHEYAHYIEIRKNSNWRHDKRWLKTILSLYPNKQLIIYDSYVKKLLKQFPSYKKYIKT